ncbi:helix-hairpin-helix domain-containing protein [Lachnospiraceae bacterium 62-35]
MIKKYRKLILALTCMICAGICYSVDREAAGSRTVTYEEAPQDDKLDGASLNSAMGEEDSPSSESEAEKEAGNSARSPDSNPLCYVHICGQVVSPGVYQVEEGSRIFQAVEAAGGLTEAAAAEYLNMAGQIQDGMKIYVPSLEEREAMGMQMDSGSASPSPSSAALVNLNTATKEQLMSLKGIGEARAEDIIHYREEQGPFHTIEDIKKVPGIKEGAFQKIKDQIRV